KKYSIDKNGGKVDETITFRRLAKLLMEILEQLPTLSVIWQFVYDGFFLGALAGAIVGTIVWTLMERGNYSVWPMVITGGLGFLLGLYVEGDAIRSLVGQDWETFFAGSNTLRTSVFESAVGVLSWMLGVMILGAIISSFRLALGGFVIGTILGTLAGTLIQVMGSELGFPVNSPITIVVVVILVIVLLVVVSFGREREIYT
ncbi:MAG: hypothetical protein AAF902_17820, partial [Chloroflexota bacterium]